LKILYNENFVKSLSTIWDFIALDAQQRANEFAQSLRKKIETLPKSPYMYRKSIYFDDDTLRDLVHKGYVVVYKIDNANDRIVILGINKYKKTIKI
jgi:toxin ParE1/3/4